MGDQRIDRDALHRFLYDRSNSRSHIKINQTELATQLDVTRGTMYRVLKEMLEGGRLRKVETLERNVGVYQIVNPDTWQAQQAGTAPVEGPKRVMWG
jgi:predicted transcriptional regulator